MSRKPKALSGGQRQRVAIGRALVRDPDVFLFDEPLSNLDAELRVDMRVEIARLHQQLGNTMVYVTHDQVEAMTLADKIVVLRVGNIEQVGAPMDLCEDPDNRFVAGFIGSPSMNFVNGTAAKGKGQSNAIPDTEFTLPSAFSGEIIIGVRPEHLEIVKSGCGLKVDIVERLGGVTYVHANAADGSKLVIESKSKSVPNAGDEIGIEFTDENVFYFDANSETRIC